MNCTDCKDTRTYQPLIGSPEPCRACVGECRAHMTADEYVAAMPNSPGIGTARNRSKRHMEAQAALKGISDAAYMGFKDSDNDINHKAIAEKYKSINQAHQAEDRAAQQEEPAYFLGQKTLVPSSNLEGNPLSLGQGLESLHCNR